MSKNITILLQVTAVVAIVSALITYFRAGSMALPHDLAQRGLAAVRRGNLLFYGLCMPIFTGWLSLKIFQNFQSKYADYAQTKYLLLAIVIGIAFQILAVVVFKMRGFTEFLALHLLYIVSYGWLMPYFLLK